MQLTVEVEGITYAVLLDSAQDISIPVRFDAPQVAVFGAASAATTPLQSGVFTGSVALGGSCNCGVHTFSPHTSGTHTECVGHITEAAITIYDTFPGGLVPATVITVAPIAARDCAETYTPVLRPDDLVITSDALADVLRERPAAFQRAVVIRTTPNSPDKLARNYDAAPPAFFTTKAMSDLRDLDVEHLLVDLPSIDRINDEGMLTNHRVFWSVPLGSTSAPGEDIYPRTVTELVYVADDISDGIYLLNLQVAPMLADAAPSRPILYPVVPL
jgi:hypothetical protein